MSFLEELAIAKFPRMGQNYRLRLHGQPALKYLKSGTRIDIPEATFYDTSEPPRALVTRPISIWADAVGDLLAVIEAYGTEAYDRIYAVKVMPRYPGATRQFTFDIEPWESKRLQDFHGACSSSSALTTASTAATVATAAQTVASPSPTGTHSEAEPPTASPGPISQAPPAPVPSLQGQGANPLCASCGKPAAGLSFCPHCGVKQ